MRTNAGDKGIYADIGENEIDVLFSRMQKQIKKRTYKYVAQKVEIVEATHPEKK